MNLWLFSSSTSNMRFGSACVTTPSMTTASSFWTCPSGLLCPFRPERRGPRRCTEDLAKYLSLRGRGRPRLAPVVGSGAAVRSRWRDDQGSRLHDAGWALLAVDANALADGERARGRVVQPGDER